MRQHPQWNALYCTSQLLLNRGYREEAAEMAEEEAKLKWRFFDIKQGKIGGSRLKNFRTMRRLSQSELAERAGVSLRTLQEYEQGKKNIDGAKIATLASLAVALDCNIVDIMEKPTLNVIIKTRS